MDFITFIFKYYISIYRNMLKEDFINKFDPAISTIPDSKPYRLEYKICKEYKISFESSLGNARKI